MKRPTVSQRRKLMGVVNYQFGSDLGSLFGRGIFVTCSRRTGRMRHVYKNGKLLGTLRPKDGYLALTIDGARLILRGTKHPPNLVVVQSDVADFIKTGGDVFAKHVVDADEELRPAEEVIITDQSGELVGVGRAVLSGYDMRFFKRGVAVKVRRGVSESAVMPVS